MAQISKFSTGGYVVHKALPDLRVSAWFDADGKLIDCELINSRGQSRKPSQAIISMVRNRWEDLPK